MIFTLSRSRRPKRRISAPKRYHHGDLRKALIDAGVAIVEAGGVEAVSLRAVARRAKVSHSAPYHHFSSKAELLAAIAAASFDRLVETIQRVAQLMKIASHLDGLRAVGRGYLEFALDHPELFRLMFRPELTHPSEHPVLLEAEARAYSTLHAVIVQCQASGELPGRDPLPLAAAAWSAVHGLAMLHVEQVLNETPVGQVPIDKLADFVVEAATLGLVHSKAR